MMNAKLAKIVKDLDEGIVNLNDIRELVRDHTDMAERLSVMATEVETTKHLLLHQKLPAQTLTLKILRKDAVPWVHIIEASRYVPPLTPEEEQEWLYHR